MSNLIFHEMKLHNFCFSANEFQTMCQLFAGCLLKRARGWGSWRVLMPLV